MAAVNLGNYILAAESSKVIESVSVRKLSEQKVGLEIMQVAVEKYIQSNEENGTSAALLTQTWARSKLGQWVALVLMAWTNDESEGKSMT